MKSVYIVYDRVGKGLYIHSDIDIPINKCYYGVHCCDYIQLCTSWWVSPWTSFEVCMTSCLETTWT